MNIIYTQKFYNTSELDIFWNFQNIKQIVINIIILFFEGLQNFNTCIHNIKEQRNY